MPTSTNINNVPRILFWSRYLISKTVYNFQTSCNRFSINKKVSFQLVSQKITLQWLDHSRQINFTQTSYRGSKSDWRQRWIHMTQAQATHFRNVLCVFLLGKFGTIGQKRDHVIKRPSTSKDQQQDNPNKHCKVIHNFYITIRVYISQISCQPLTGALE